MPRDAWPPRLKRSVITVAHALKQRHDNAAAVVRFYVGEATPAKAPPRAFSHDDRALMFPKEKLEHGPCPADVLNAAVEAGRLRIHHAERAKETLAVVARRISNDKGAVVHWCTAQQAAELEAAEA